MEVRPGYVRTEAGVLPEDWDVDCVGRSYDVCNQLRLPISQSVRERMSGPYPYYGPTDVQGWINEYRVEGEYALIGEDGDHFLKWQSQSMTLLVRGRFNVNNHAHLVRGTENLTAWFYWYFASRDLTPYLTRQGAGRYKLTKAALLKIPCALPSPAEQRLIITALSDMDALLSSLDSLIAKKRDLKQAAAQQLLTGNIRLAGFTGEWEVKRLGGQVVKLRKTNRPSSAGRNEGKYPFFTNSTKPCDKYVDEFDFDTEAIIANTGGEAHFNYSNGRFAAMADCFVFGSLVVTRFLYFVLKSIERRINDTGFTGSGIRHLDKKYFEDIELSFPPTAEEQTAIAAVLSDMDTELSALEVRRNKARMLKQGMMQELLTGKTRLVPTERASA